MLTATELRALNYATAEELIKTQGGGSPRLALRLLLASGNYKYVHINELFKIHLLAYAQDNLFVVGTKGEEK